MLIAVYSVICLGAIGISFISLLDQKAVNNLAVRIITIVILAISWYEPLTFVSGLWAKTGGPPEWLLIAIPLLLMAPFFYTTVTIFTGGTSLGERIQNSITMRMTATGAQEFPAADKAEAAQNWDKAFELYRDKYLPNQYHNPILWNRIVGIMRRWNDLERALNELLNMVKGAPSEDSRLYYALGAADVLAVGLGSKGRALKLLKAAR
jgi:hypothetical protein